MSVLGIMLMVGFLFALAMAHLPVSLAVMEHPIRIFAIVVFSLGAWCSR